MTTTAIVVVGVHLEPMTEQIEKTKYNPDTGVPYKVQEKREYFAIEGTNIEVEFDESEHFQYAFYGDHRTYFAGIKALEVNEWTTDGWNIERCKELPDLTPFREQAATMLREKFGYTGQVKTFVLNYVNS